MSVRLSSAFWMAASRSIALRRQHRLFRRHDARRPEIGLRRVHDQRAQRIFERLDLGFADDDRFFVARDFRLRFDDVDRRDRADLDPPLVVLERLLREIERLLRHLELPDRPDEIVIRVSHGARRLRDLLLQLQVDDLLLLLADQQLLPRRSMVKFAQQRLREVEVEVRRQPRVERVGRIAGRVPRAVERRLVASAAPFQRLRDARRSIGNPRWSTKLLPERKFCGGLLLLFLVVFANTTGA